MNKAGQIAICAVVFCVAFMIFGRYLTREFRAQEKILKPLLQARATEDEVYAVLGTNSLSRYEKGSKSWDSLVTILKNEPDRWFQVREGTRKYSKGVQYSTPDMQTWIFFDADHKIADYYIGTQ
jgi:hypothetical protein